MFYPRASQVGRPLPRRQRLTPGTKHHGVTARAMPTEFVAPAPITGGLLNQNDFISINGHAITGFNVNASDADNSLILAINAISPDTGVTAELDRRGHLVLKADDGRNIAVEVSGNASVQLGVGATTVQTATLNLHSPDQYQLTGGSEAAMIRSERVRRCGYLRSG